jgi:tRNA dimethylallyltransferase
LNFLVIITGPTASGKTTAAIETAKYFKTEIVSADSRQIYSELSIGTAVPSASELAAVKHYFIQSHSIFENYNASRYEAEAIEVLENLFKKNNIVILTGGSMLYIDAVCKGIDDIPDIDPELRMNIKRQLEETGIDNLRVQLKKLDPEYYSHVDLKNPARIVHALEVCLMTGKPYSSFRKKTPKKRDFALIKTALNCERAELHMRINNRVDAMIQNGLEQEAQEVFHLKHLNSLNTVGYREFFDYFEGKISKEKAIELIKRNTRRYARKQITWFRNDPDVTWFNSGETKQLIKFIESVLNKQ